MTLSDSLLFLSTPLRGLQILFTCVLGISHICSLFLSGACPWPTPSPGPPLSILPAAAKGGLPKRQTDHFLLKALKSSSLPLDEAHSS